MVACSHTTQMTDLYRDPGVTSLKFDRVAAIALTDDAQMRRTVEDEMVQQIGPKAVAANTILSADDYKSADAVRAKLQSLKIDGAVVLSLLSIGEEPIDPQGGMSDSQKSFSGYYGHGGGGGVYAYENVARLQTQIFSVPDNKLLWSAATKTFEPKDAKQMIAATAAQIRSELQKDGLVQKP